MKQEFDPKAFEKKWQDYWQENGTYSTNFESSKPKKYILDMFPYPSGAGLHVGHPRGYIGTDVYSRFQRMKGFEVLHPMGFDAFGLPAEEYALKMKTTPQLSVSQNIQRYKQQLEIMGVDYDWSNMVSTTDEQFYKWTQWIFLECYKKGLAYESNEPINWCPSCKTGLANEDLNSDGTCERCGTLVEKKPLRQWVLKITDYADKLLTGLDTLPLWPDFVKESQRNWIGKSEGSEFVFKLVDANGNGLEESLTVFTTRADTLFGVTYVVVAPEHALVTNSAIVNKHEVLGYQESAFKKNEIERSNQTLEKTGVKVDGVFAVHPATGEHIPVYVADYVIGSYGTGAVMGVPAHDERDFAFAKKYNIPVKKVVFIENGDRRENEEFRNGGCGVIFDPATQKYAVAKWNDDGRVLLFAGGVDDGEDVHDGVLREVKEESGLYDIKHFEWVDTAYAHYFNKAKNVNRVARAECYLAILNSADAQEVHREPHENFELVWMSAQEILNHWIEKNDSGLHHYIHFFKQAVARAIELGHDAVSSSKVFAANAFCDDGIVELESGVNGITSEEARIKITEQFGKKVVNYKIRDWTFSRQRYWGEPIPLVFDANHKAYPLHMSELPVTLPNVEFYEPTGTGESPLANISEWMNVEGYVAEDGSVKTIKEGESAPTGVAVQKFTRESNTMPGWAGSSWYYIRYIDMNNDNEFISKEREQKWLPVDMYVGGVEHATRHLIYARFWHKVLFDLGFVHTEEPFTVLKNQGLIMASDGRKMSKRWANVVNPDDVIAMFGADAFRMFELFIAPFDQTTPWQDDGVVGTRRFLERVHKLMIADHKEGEESAEVLKALHKSIKKLTDGIENFAFNTCVSDLMITLKVLEKQEDGVTVEAKKIFAQLLAPMAPHATEEWWRMLGEETSIHNSAWPQYDEKYLVDDEMTIAVQINGKVRATVVIAADADEAAVRELVYAQEAVQKYTTGVEIKKEMYIPGKIYTIVI
ncbi:MAG TPA: class I tRNA ligase family protein [Candidatus Paceibacterota bacterium]